MAKALFIGGKLVESGQHLTFAPAMPPTRYLDATFVEMDDYEMITLKLDDGKVVKIAKAGIRLRDPRAMAFAASVLKRKKG